jgi:hypothetical protein
MNFPINLLIGNTIIIINKTDEIATHKHTFCVDFAYSIIKSEDDIYFIIIFYILFFIVNI